MKRNKSSLLPDEKGARPLSGRISATHFGGTEIQVCPSDSGNRSSLRPSGSGIRMSSPMGFMWGKLSSLPGPPPPKKTETPISYLRPPWDRASINLTVFLFFPFHPSPFTLQGRQDLPRRGGHVVAGIGEIRQPSIFLDLAWHGPVPFGLKQRRNGSGERSAWELPSWAEEQPTRPKVD